MTETCQTTTNYSGATSLGGGGNTIKKVGVILDTGHPAIGTTVTTVSFYLSKYGSPSGTPSCKVWDDTGSNVATSSSSTLDDWEDLTTSYVKVTFTFSAGFTPAADYRIAIEGGTTSDSNEVNLGSSSPSEYTNQEQSYYRTNTSSWTDNSTRSVSWCWSSGSVSTSNVFPPPPVAYI